MRPLILSCFFVAASNVAYCWAFISNVRRPIPLNRPNKQFYSKEFLYSSFNLFGMNDDDEIQDPSSIPSLSQEELQSFLNEMSQSPKVTSEDDNDNWIKNEQDLKIYADLLRELETSGGEDGVYSNILGVLNSSSSSSDKVVIPPAVADADSLLVDDDIPVEEEESLMASASVLDDADGIGETMFGKLPSEIDATTDIADPFTGTDDMMKRALQEALIEVRKTAPLDLASDPRSILNDKEMMKELNAIFDRANQQLLASISDIRKEQEDLSKATAMGRSSSIEAEERRLVEAEESVSRLVSKVRQETQEVENAVLNLKDAQEKMSEDPLLQAAVLKRAGILKQAALIGAMLFTFRSLGDLGSMLSSMGSPSDGLIASHGYAAAIQGIIALVCAVYFKFI